MVSIVVMKQSCASTSYSSSLDNYQSDPPLGFKMNFKSIMWVLRRDAIRHSYHIINDYCILLLFLHGIYVLLHKTPTVIETISMSIVKI
jgi:hypothetical protein